MLLLLFTLQDGRIKELRDNGIGFLGLFKNGKLDGPVWHGLIGEPVLGQGFLYGHLNKKGKLTGDDVAYIYPDYVTSLVGQFEDKIMKSARESKITQLTCVDGLIQAKFSRPAENSVSFYYDQATNETLGTMLLVRDPYEAKTVELKDSLIPNAGQGIFAIRDIPRGQVNYYSRCRLMGSLSARPQLIL